MIADFGWRISDWGLQVLAIVRIILWQHFERPGQKAPAPLCLVLPNEAKD